MNSPERILGLRGENLWDKSQQLRFTLKRAIKNNPADALLLSGGIDSSILAALDSETPAITVALQERGPDLGWAQRVAEQLGVRWYGIELNPNQALTDVAELIYLTKNYDPGIKNDVAIYEALKYATSLGYRTIRTGDASDEWFAGYSELHKQEENLQQIVRSLIPHIRLPVTRLSRAMGLRVTYPYLYEEVLDLARSLDYFDNIAILPGFGPGDIAQQFDPTLVGRESWGKIVLRNAAYGLIPANLIWRMKTAIEFGSGTNDLEQIISQQVTRQEIREMRQSGKHFWNRYHGKLYIMYRDMGLEPELPREGEYACTWCGGGVVQGRTHCSTCGAFPSNVRTRRVFQQGN